MPELEYDSNTNTTTNISHSNSVDRLDRVLSEVEESDKESVDFLTSMFPQIPSQLIIFLYIHKFDKNQSGVAEYLIGMLYNNVPVDSTEGGNQTNQNNQNDNSIGVGVISNNIDNNTTNNGNESDVDTDELVNRIIDKIKIMKYNHTQKLIIEKKTKNIRNKKIQEMISNKYSNISVTPLYDEKTGKLIKKQYDPKTFLGVTLNGYISSSSTPSTSSSSIFNWGKGAVIHSNIALKPTLKKNKDIIRYFENQVVTHKGEKTIVVKTEYEKEQDLLYNGNLRSKENKGSMAKAAASKNKTKSIKK